MAKNEKTPPPARTAPKKAAQPPADAKDAGGAADTAAAERFVHDLEVRGEAAKPSPSGLPLSATHAIVEENPDGTVKEVKRARFKAF